MPIPGGIVAVTIEMIESDGRTITAKGLAGFATAAAGFAATTARFATAAAGFAATTARFAATTARFATAAAGFAATTARFATAAGFATAAASTYGQVANIKVPKDDLVMEAAKAFSLQGNES